MYFNMEHSKRNMAFIKMLPLVHIQRLCAKELLYTITNFIRVETNLI